MAKKTARKREVITDGNFFTADNGQNGNRVFISVGKTINIGNFESVRVEYGFGKTVQDGQKFSDVKNRCLKIVLEDVNEMIDIVEKSLK